MARPCATSPRHGSRAARRALGSAAGPRAAGGDRAGPAALVQPAGDLLFEDRWRADGGSSTTAERHHFSGQRHNPGRVKSWM